MAVPELERAPDHGLLATLRDLERRSGAPPTCEDVAEAVGVPEEYSAFIERRLELNERRGLVVHDGAGRWLLTAAGTALAGEQPYAG